MHELDKLGLAYLHLLHVGNEPLLADIRALWKAVLIVNRPSRPREQIGSDVEAGLADIEAYGQAILANPDFLERLKTNAPLNTGDRNTFYAGGAEGYIDYPSMQGTQM
jgi:2,4-dienoyl-CoA reductase-like NADH-dependent reductase (Old Yellow Enzyme family)